MLGGPHGDSLFMLAREWHGAADLSAGDGSGHVLLATSPAPHAGRS